MLQHGPLLDVELEIAGDIGREFRLTKSRGIKSECPDYSGSTVLIIDESKVPATARLPMNGKPNFTPSSSENPISSIRVSSASMRASPIITPSTPSNAPASGTVSRCDPMTTRLSFSEVPWVGAKVANRVNNYGTTGRLTPGAKSAMHIMHRRREIRSGNTPGILRIASEFAASIDRKLRRRCPTSHYEPRYVLYP